MAEKKSNWDDIPSLEGFEVEWDYEPENPEGKRAHKRMKETELCPVLNVKAIPVKVASHGFEEKGYMVDITPAGVAVNLQTRLDREKLIMVGFFLGEQKIISKATVKHVQKIDGKFRTGLLFENIDQESADFVSSLFASKMSDF